MKFSDYIKNLFHVFFIDNLIFFLNEIFKQTQNIVNRSLI
jgi:hypothetical protein